MRPRVWPAMVAATLGIAVLLALGAWQVQRLAWKQGLLTAIDERLAAPAEDLATLLAAEEAGDDIEFRKAALRGQFLHADEKLMLNTFDGEVGWRVITPMLSDAGIAVLVDRGFIPDGLRDAAKRVSPDVANLTGIVRRHGTPRGLFSPDNDAARNMWYWWDVPGMLAASRIPPNARVAPFVIQAVPAAEAADFPRPQEPRAAFRNNHLQYAITWFALALVLAIMAFLFARQQRA